MSRQLQVIAPGRQAGGANLLLARSAARLAHRHGFQLSLVDFEDGATHALWRTEGIPFDFQRYEVGGDIKIGRADVVIVSLLGAKLFPDRLKGNTAVRLLAWCTAPQDAFKFLPPAYFFNNCSWSVKAALARGVFSAHRGRIAKFLSEGASRGGVIFMDVHCHDINERLFGPGIAPAIIPICTGVTDETPRPSFPNSGKAYWVGRVTDFKTEPFIAMTRALLRPGSPIKQVVVIGDGADLEKSKERLSGLPVTWLGYVEPSRLDKELKENADIIFGHGTALLEGAKLGIPSLLVDGTYEKIKSDEVRSEWLHLCQPGYVMKICAAKELYGRPVDVCLGELNNDSERISKADYHHWKDYHHPDVIADKLAEVISHGDYTYDDFLRSGAAKPGGFGALLDWSKRAIFGRKY